MLGRYGGLAGMDYCTCLHDFPLCQIVYVH